jgi:hypothetical protein
MTHTFFSFVPIAKRQSGFFRLYPTCEIFCEILPFWAEVCARLINLLLQMKKELTFIQLLDLLNHALDVEIGKKVQ